MMRKINDENERIKRRHGIWLREAKGQDNTSVEKALSAILRFEESTKSKNFKAFHIDQATGFKSFLAKSKNQRTGNPLSKATIDSTLRCVKTFFKWLADKPGYTSRIKHADCEYFNNNMKDARAAHTKRDIPYPTMEQARHAFSLMPSETIFDQRNRAIFAFLMLTGARDGAIATLRLKHIDLVSGSVFQDGRDVDTKNSKTITTTFLPFDRAYYDCFESWVNKLRHDNLFGHDDVLFPKPAMGLGESGGFAVLGLSRECYASGAKICSIIKNAFTSAGLPAFGPHSFRKTLIMFGDKHCKDRESFKAWSVNIGHTSVVTSVGSYMPVSPERQAEIIRGMRP
ncbi:tyrosine recombinase XerC [Ahrensia sp. R2A130]|uniref:site-specific integrase n=1 Tax=Ahrensia sp. R2A130 TaxID=744979 RepID=UPI0001E0F108|nr:site-specific integrase [Ahrensia sp. R2A130]EFL88045.1 phage integrase family protein [Ahrensia sp. R2A130]